MEKVGEAAGGAEDAVLALYGRDYLQLLLLVDVDRVSAFGTPRRHGFAGCELDQLGYAADCAVTHLRFR